MYWAEAGAKTRKVGARVSKSLISLSMRVFFLGLTNCFSLLGLIVLDEIFF